MREKRPTIPFTIRIDEELFNTFKDLEEASAGVRKSKMAADCLKKGLEQILQSSPSLKDDLDEYRKRRSGTHSTTTSNRVVEKKRKSLYYKVG